MQSDAQKAPWMSVDGVALGGPGRALSQQANGKDYANQTMQTYV